MASSKILIASRNLPVFEGSGSVAHMFDLIACLRKQGFEIFYAYLGSGQEASRPFLDLARLHVVNTQTLPPDGWPKLYDSLLSPNEAAIVMNAYNRCKPDILIADYLWLADIFDIIPAQDKVARIIFAHESRRRIIESLDATPLKRISHEHWDEAKESRLLRKADALLVLQKEDQEAMQKLAPAVKTVRIGVSDRIVRHDPAQEIPGRCMYIGTDFAENVLALGWLFEKVWPQVLQAVPYSRLVICGSICKKISNAHPSMFLAGWVEDIGAVSAQAQISLIPHLLHGGTKLKFIRALAHGRPVVANRCGIDGFPEAENTCALVSDDPAGFVRHMITVITDDGKRAAMREAAYALADKRLSPEAAYGEFFAYLRGNAPRI